MTTQHTHDAPQQRSTADVIATGVALVLAVIAGVVAVSSSVFYPMAADPCGADNCNTQAISVAYVVTWGGVAVAAIVAIGGTLFAALRRRAMWVWPTAALVLIVVTVVAGVLLAGSVTPHH